MATEVVLGCKSLEEALAFFVDELGFRVDAIFPSDNPSVTTISGYGVRVRLEQDRIDQSGVQTWVEGRAGMQYRDLIPGRQEGRYIASHIRIPGGGDVPDYVHFHEIGFQMIYCYKGWVRVVYEDQGAPFVLSAGDCVLQPPKIRHRVLECSAGLEVIEVASPADHLTHADHEMALPTGNLYAERDYHGQQFVRHIASANEWKPWRVSGFESRDTGIAAATDHLVGAAVVRPMRPKTETLEVNMCRSDNDLLFTFALQGTVLLQRDGHDSERLTPGDCFTMPAGNGYGLTEWSDDLEFLEVSSPPLPFC